MLRRMLLRALYLGLAIAGAVWTWSYNLAHMTAHAGSFDVAVFIAEAFSTPAGGSLSADITIAGLTGSIWMVAEARRLGMRHAWAYVVLTFLVAFACAFPLFLFVREGKLREGAPA